MPKTLQSALEEVLFQQVDFAGLSEVDRFAGSWSVRPIVSARRLETLAAEVSKLGAQAAEAFDSMKLLPAELAAKSVKQVYPPLSARNYQAAAQWIAGDGSRLSLSDALVMDLHQRLFRGSKLAASTRGRYRTTAHVGIVAAAVVPAAMTELIAWYQERVEDNDCHPLFPVVVVFVQFLRISPFEMGNGAMALLLLRYLLLRAGYHFVTYAPVEVLCLKQGFPGLGRSIAAKYPSGVRWDTAFWMLIVVLGKGVDELEAIAREERQSADRLPTLSNQILQVFERVPRAQVGEITTRTKGNRNTIKVHLSDLVDRGLLVRHGAGRSTWYARPA